MSIKWVFFDVGSTLMNEEAAQEKRFVNVAADIKSASNKIVDYMEFSSVMEQGAINRDNSPFYYATKKYGINKSYPYLSEDEILYPEAKETLKQVKKKYKVGIIANQPPALEERLKMHGIAEYIDAIFGSADVGLKKPNIEFYHHALSSVGCLQSEAVMIGDRLDNDIVPAKKAGMKTIRILYGYFSKTEVLSEDETPDYTVSSLIDIPNLLDNI